MILARIAERTYRLADGSLDDLAAHLIACGYDRCLQQSPHDFARFWREPQAAKRY